MTRYHVAGFKTCGYYQRAVKRGQEVAKKDEYEFEKEEYSTRAQYKAALASLRAKLDDGEQTKAEHHTSSPFVWKEEDGRNIFVGGCDDFLALTSGI
eukprot:snap_masked-scaffold_2-processed-gene-6.14-mRNA-1 protein AED:1.00 eAED:1.00 QI:0/-1/0/0/-1/1/1/0/96